MRQTRQVGICLGQASWFSSRIEKSQVLFLEIDYLD
jgi:hypothetical protein